MQTTLPFSRAASGRPPRRLGRAVNPLKARTWRPLLALLALLSGGAAWGQSITNYAQPNGSFAATAGSYTPLAGGTTSALSTGTTDDGTFDGIPLGFTFVFNGSPYTTVSASTNGHLVFAAAAASNASNGLASTAPRPIVAPLWDDLDIVNASNFSYLTTGAAGNRVFTAEWKSVKWYWSASSLISFQVKLYEATGAVQFVYNQDDAVSPGTLASASVGLAAAATGSGNYLSLSSLGASPTLSSTSETTTINTKPATGQTYTFTPPQVAAPSAPAVAFSAVAGTSFNLVITDNSTTETNFAVFRSLDNVNFTQVASVASTAPAGTGGSQTLAQTGLSFGTTYYYRVFAASEGFISPVSTGQQATASGTLCGTGGVVPIGPNAVAAGGYATLTAALAALNTQGVCPGGTVLELQNDYVSTGETFPLAYTFTGGSQANPVTIRPAANVSSTLSISGSGAAIFNLINGDWLTIDGRPGGTGSTSRLSITNSSTGTTGTDGSAIRFIDDATNNTIRYCNLQSASANTGGGLVAFAASTPAVTGNSNNTIEYCDFVSTPIYGVYSSGQSTTVPNRANRILNNKIHDFNRLSGVTGGVNLTSTGNTAWEISGNSFYQTATRTYSSGAVHFAINIGTGTGYTIKNNFIGGGAEGAASGTYTLAGSTTTRYAGIQASFSSGGTNLIQGNVIRRFNLNSTSGTTTGLGIWSGIYVGSGNATIGGSGAGEGNTIGDDASTGSIVTTVSNTAVTIGIRSESSGTVSIVGNKVGGITTNAATQPGAVGNGLTGIWVSSGTNVITGNVVGSTSTANSLLAANANNSTSNTQAVRGIVSSSFTSAVIQGNTVANLHNAANANNSAHQVIGILTSSGANTIGGDNAGEGNTVRNLTNAAPNGSNSGSSAVLGIAQTSTSGLQTVVRNTVYALGSTASSAPGLNVLGIFFNGSSTAGNRIARNLVHSTYLLATNTTLMASYGIHLASGAADVVNNMVRVGLGPDGAAATPTGNQTNGGVQWAGLYKNSTSTVNNFYHNTFYVGGSGVAAGSAPGSHALWLTTTNADAIRNNVLVNARSGSGTHGALNLNSAAGTTISNNIYYAPGTGGTVAVIGGTATGTVTGDANSATADPQLLAPTAATPDLHVSTTAATAVESGGAALGVTNDYDGDLRFGAAGYAGTGTAPDIGADEGNFLGGDLVAPTITYTALGNTTSTANRALSNVVITDNSGGSGLNVAAGQGPRLYFRRLNADGTPLDANVINDNTSGTDGWKYVPANGTTSPFDFTIDYGLLFTGNGAGVTAGQRIQYFVVAADQAGNVALNAGTLPGGADKPSSVALTTANLPTGTLNSYRVALALSGTLSVGAGQPYPSLTGTGGLFEALNQNVVAGNLTVNITSDLTEPGTVGLSQLTEEGSGAGSYTVLIQADGTTERLITGNGFSGGMIRLNGADRVTFDGGAGKYLRLRNTNSATASPTLTFLNDATGNTLTRCTIESGNTVSTSGTILFYNGTSTGNDNNTISFCDIRELSAAPNTVPAVAIRSFTDNGVAAATNSGNAIRGNVIRNFTSNGVQLNATGNGDNWLIGGATAADGNRIYQEAARSTTLTAINLLGGSAHTVSRNSIYQTAGQNTSGFTGISVAAGNGHTVSFNTIGGAAADASGTTLTTGSTTTGLNLALASGTASSVQGNLVRNITLTSSSSSFCGIQLSSGTADIGSTTGNVIGDVTAALGVAVKYDSYGIRVSSSTAAVVRNNQVRNLNAVSGTTNGTFLFGLSVSGTGAAHTVSGNVVSGLVSASVPDLSGEYNAQTIGAFITATGAVTVDGNQFSNIGNTATGGASGSLVHAVAGLVCQGNGTGSVVRNNRVWNVFASSTGTGTSADLVYGLSIQGTTNATVANNMVALTTGSSAAPVLYGLSDLSTGTNAYYYNSVYLSGTGSSSTYAFRRSSSATVTLRNNVFYNERSGAGSNFAIGTSSTSGWTATSSNNNFFVTTNAAQVGQWGSTALTLAGWQAAQPAGSGGDAASFADTPTGTPAATLFTDVTTGNLKINPAYYTTASLLESKGVAVAGITTDFEGDTRPGPGGSTNGGGTAPDLGADEFDGTPALNMVYVSSTVTQQLGNVFAGQTNQAIVRLEVVTQNQASPLSLTQLVLNATGTSNLASINGNAKVYYTGTSTTFSTSTLFGSVAPAAGDLTVTGTQVLQPGSNYFFVAYDIAAGAQLGDTFDAEVTSLTVGGTAYTPTVTAPAGNRVIPGPMSGNYLVGTTLGTEDFATLTDAAVNLNNRGVVTGQSVSLRLTNPGASKPYNAANGETFPISFGQVALSAGQSVTLQPNPGTANPLVTGTGTNLLILEGADNLVIDGNDGSGNRNLTLRNTSGTAVLLRNDATANTLRYLTLESGNTSTGSGTVVVLTSVTPIGGATGNDGNTIEFCDLRDRSDATGVPANAIYASGTAAASNSGNVIRANVIRNFTNSGVLVGGTGNGDNWIIGGTSAGQGNQLYQEASRSSSTTWISVAAGSGHTISNNSLYMAQPGGTATNTLTGTFTGIALTGAGNGHTVSFNSIGGSNGSRTGAAFTATGSNNRTLLLLTVGSTTPAEVQGNQLGNLTFTGSSAAIGLSLTAGSANIGTSTANVFGGSAAQAINSGYDTDLIRLGSGAGTVVVANNVLANFNHTRTGNDRVAGLTILGGTVTVRNNVLRDWTFGTTGTATTVDGFWPYGIGSSSSGVLTIEGNQIYNLSSTASSGTAMSLAGIVLNSAASGSVVQRNRIYGLSFGTLATGTGSSAPVVWGMLAQAGNATFANNQISLTPGGTETQVRGIEATSATAANVNRFYYNSVYLGGTAGGTTSKSYAFWRSNTTTPGGVELRNNLLYNARTGGASNFALGAASTTNWPATTSNYNLLFVTDATKVAEWATGTALSFAGWKAAQTAGSGGDASSMSETTANVAAANLFVDAAAGNLNLNPANPEAWYANGTGVQVPGLSADFDNAGAVRSVTVAAGGTDIGSDEFTPTSTPPVLTASAAPAPGGTQTFSLGGRVLASLTYGTAGTVPGIVTARYYSGTNPLNPLVSARYQNSFLRLEPTADGNGYSYDLTLYYDDALLGTVNPESSLRLSRRDLTTLLYQFYDQSVLDELANTLVQTGLTAFGDFTGSDLTAPLPVSLTRFEAVRQGADAMLTWATAQEKNNRGFEVQVSLDGRTFRTLGFVASEAPNSTSARHYQFVDREAGKQGLRYYRLRQLDLDGTQALFGPRTVRFEAVTTLAAVAFPNPFAGSELTLEVTAPASGATELLLLDALGRTVLRQSVQLQAGVQRLPLRLSDTLPAGAYVLRLSTAGQTSTLRVVKQ